MAFFTQTIDVNGCKLSLRRGGKGVPLMYPHGTDGLAEWPAILDTLAERFELIAPDHPGFGGSEVPGWIDDVADLAYLYLDAIEALGLSGVHVVGQSLGGWIALEMAPRSTQRLLNRIASARFGGSRASSTLGWSDGCIGHLPHIERAPAVAQALQAFLPSLIPPRAKTFSVTLRCSPFWASHRKSAIADLRTHNPISGRP